MCVNYQGVATALVILIFWLANKSSLKKSEWVMMLFLRPTSFRTWMCKTGPWIGSDPLLRCCCFVKGLEDCANTLIGSETEGIKGISGGQKRRLSVGIELVTNPRVLVLDEPTSGLDSEIALTIMTTLKELASRGRTVSGEQGLQAHRCFYAKLFEVLSIGQRLEKIICCCGKCPGNFQGECSTQSLHPL